MYSPTELGFDASRSAVLAVRAAGIAPDPVRPVELLRLKSDRLVFRVHCQGCRPASVVVKGRGRARAGLEQLFYESVLWHLPVRTATLYGTFEEDDHTWLVLEDVGNSELALDDEECRQELSTWCANVHRKSFVLHGLPPLPDRGPTHFWHRLQRARVVLSERLDPAIKPRERTILRDAIGACDAVVAAWSAVSRACEGLPSTVVHGDLAAQNLRFHRVAGGRLELVVLDWEKAGWGVPAVDLAHLSLSEYTAAGGIASSEYSPEDLKMAAWAGRLFRVLVHDFFMKPPDAVERYANRLWAALGEAR